MVPGAAPHRLTVEEEDHGVVALSAFIYALYHWLERVGEVHVIGDALAPRRLMDAILDGARLGCCL